jgi:hypothetical protein
MLRDLDDALEGLTAAEIHLLAYLACLLSLYDGRPVSDWQYSFVKSSWGSPYASAIDHSVNSLSQAGLAKVSEIIRITDEGAEFVNFLQLQSEHSWRVPFLKGATASALSIPAGVIRSGLYEEPGLRIESIHRGPRHLLEEQGLPALHRHFAALHEVLGLEHRDLMIPAVVWIRYLAEAAEANAFPNEAVGAHPGGDAFGAD